MKATQKIRLGFVFLAFCAALSFGLFVSTPEEVSAFPEMSPDGVTCTPCHTDGRTGDASADPADPAEPAEPAQPTPPAPPVPTLTEAPPASGGSGNSVLIPGVIAVVIVVGGIVVVLNRKKK